jgi:hypothetical protein
LSFFRFSNLVAAKGRIVQSVVSLFCPLTSVFLTVAIKRQIWRHFLNGLRPDAADPLQVGGAVLGLIRSTATGSARCGLLTPYTRKKTARGVHSAADPSLFQTPP